MWSMLRHKGVSKRFIERVNTVSILERIERLTKNEHRIALGVRSEDRVQLRRILRAAKEAEDSGFGEIILAGDLPVTSCREIVATKEPEKTLLELLGRGEVDAAIRGTAKASLILKLIKDNLHPESFFRIAFLETSKGHQFLFAPVGIDEGDTIPEKMSMIASATRILKTLEIEPKIAIISGGRPEDRGRSRLVDSTLEESQRLTVKAKRENPYEINNYGILIEDAIRSKANFILAPNGISGNLIYRTLIHLGSGRSHGATYVGIKPVLIDTSRSAPMKEYLNAIRFASALASLSKISGKKAI